ncbi:hypothetical protein FDECE_526 [Fusarium decemcellulare]|nr:hypothetical protein FDECE_526 [Fusarium decemcellulare]
MRWEASTPSVGPSDQQLLPKLHSTLSQRQEHLLIASVTTSYVVKTSRSRMSRSKEAKCQRLGCVGLHFWASSRHRTEVQDIMKSNADVLGVVVGPEIMRARNGIFNTAVAITHHHPGQLAREARQPVAKVVSISSARPSSTIAGKLDIEVI